MSKLSTEINPIVRYNGDLYECPLCRHTISIWERIVYSDGVQVSASKVAMCDNEDKIGPIDSCPLSFPPEDFYKATIREAVDTWNDFYEALSK